MNSFDKLECPLLNNYKNICAIIQVLILDKGNMKLNLFKETVILTSLISS